MRIIPISLLVLLVLIQYPLWFGKGGLFKVHELGRKLEAQQNQNMQFQSRNAQLEGEVRDLRDGQSASAHLNQGGAIEERARFELGMIREGEIFVQVLPSTHAAINTIPNTSTNTTQNTNATAPLNHSNTVPLTLKPTK